MAITPPKLMDYSAAIQANQSMSNAFKQLGNTSQDYMDYAEKKKQNGIANQFNVDKAAETKRINDFSISDTNRKYQDGINSANAKKEANASTFKTLYPNKAKDMALHFGDIPSKENAYKMSEAFGNVDIKNFDSNRDFVYGKDKDEKQFKYDARQDEIDNNLKKQELGIKKYNAYKPPALTQADKLLAIMMGNNMPNVSNPSAQNGNTTTTSTVGNVNQNTQAVVQSQEMPLLKVGQANKPFTQQDYASKSLVTTIADKKGNKYDFNPVTGRKVLVSVPTEIEEIKTQNLKNEQSDEIVSLQNTIDNSNKLIDQIGGVANSKDLEYATGWMTPLSSIPGSDAKNIAAEVETIKGGAFTTAISALRGLGAMSEMEGKKVTDSIANLDMGQSTEQVRKQLNQIKETMERAKNNAVKKLQNRNVNTQEAPEKKYSDEEVLKALQGGE